jgi:hypothetical protein
MTLGPYALVLSFILDKATDKPFSKMDLFRMQFSKKIAKTIKKKEIKTTTVYRGMKISKQLFRDQFGY